MADIGETLAPETDEGDTIVFNLRQIKCPNHQINISKVCISNDCKLRLLCDKCPAHENHKLIMKVEEMNDLYKAQNDYYGEKSNTYYSTFKDLESNLQNEVNIMKKYFDEQMNNFLNRMKNSLRSMNKDKYLELLDASFKESKNDNSTSSEEKLSEQLMNLPFEQKKEKSEPFVQDLRKYQMKKILELFDNLKKDIDKIKDFNFDHEFEFSNYSKDGKFPYTLSESNTKVTKSKESNLTVCRTILPMEIGGTYDLEFLPEYKGKGDFQVGFATMSCFDKNNLQSKHSWILSNKGIIIDDELMNDAVLLENNVKVRFVVNTKDWVLEFYLGDDKLATVDFNDSNGTHENLIFYPMVAIKDVGDSVSLKSKRIK